MQPALPCDAVMFCSVRENLPMLLIPCVFAVTVPGIEALEVDSMCKIKSVYNCCSQLKIGTDCIDTHPLLP